MANPNGIAGWHQIVVNGTVIDTIYLAEGIFDATELYRQDTGCMLPVSARRRAMSQSDFGDRFNFPQLAECR